MVVHIKSHIWLEKLNASCCRLLLLHSDQDVEENVSELVSSDMIIDQIGLVKLSDILEDLF